MKYLLIPIILVLAFVSATYSGRGNFVYEVAAKDGGSNGFNHVLCTCNELTREYKVSYSEPGFEKFAHCCEDDLPKKALRLRDQCDALVKQGTDTSGTFESGGFQVTFQVKDNNNFSYSIREVE